MFSTRFLTVAALAAVLSVPAAALAQSAPPAPGAPLPGAVPAQPGMHRGHHHRNAFRAALGRLNLSDAQKSQIQQAFTQSRAANRNADPATRKANRDKLHAQIESILTPAQRTQLQAELRQDRARYPAGAPMPHPVPLPATTPTH